MKARIKKISVLCVVALTVGILSGCSGNSATSTTAENTSAKAASDKESAASKADDKQTEAAKQNKGSKDSDAKFTVGFDKDFPPMGFVGDDGEFTGFDLELAKEAAKRLNMEVVYQPIAWEAKELEIENGNIDCIWNGFTMEDREDKYTFVGPYMANKQVFVVKEEGIQSVSDLKGKTVEVQKDSSGLTALNRDENKSLKDSFASLVEVGDYQSAMMDLETGACDAVCMDSVVAEYQIKSTKKPFRILKDSLSEEKYGIGFKKGNTALSDAVKKTLLEMKEDGTVDKITEKWFGTKDSFVLQ